MLKEFADIAGSSHSDGLVFDGRRYLKGKEAETLQAGGLLEAVPSKSGWDYRLTQEGRALTKVMARSRDAAADGKSAGKAQSARAKDTPVVGKAAVAKNAANEKLSSDKAAEPETLVKTALDNPEEAERKARVLQGEPVYTVDRLYEYTDFKSLKEWAVGIFNKAGNKAVNDEIGTVDLTAKSVKDSMAHGMNPAKAAAFEAVPYVVEKGVVVASTKHGEMTSYFISAPVRIAGNDDVVTVLVHHDVNKKRMYLHSVTTKENLLNTQDSTADTQVSQPRGKLYSGDIASVLKKLLEYKTQGGKTENTPSEGLRFSRSEQTKSAFENRIDALFGGAKANLKGVRVLDKSDLLDMLGYGAMPVELNESKVVLNRKNHPEMTAQQWKKVPEWLDNPVAVLKSKTHDKRLVFVPDELIDGAPVYLVVEPNSRGLDIHVLVNGYAKDGNPQQTFRDIWRDLANGNTEFVDSKKARELLGRSGLQLPRLPSLNTSRKKILTEKNLQGYRKSEKTDTGQQHAESIKKRLAESIGGLAEQVDVAAVSETAPDKAQMLLSERVEGWFDGRTGKITLVAENLTPERAVWVAWHELGHRGFAAEGFAKYREELERADGNSLIRRIADAVQEEREGTGDAAASVRSAAVEEAIVELYAAQRTGDWSGIENRYGVKVGNGLKRGIAGVLARIGALLRRVLQRLTGKADGAMSDADVFAMLADLHGNVEGARDAVSDGNHRAVMFARAEDGAAERSKSESLEKLRRAETIRISGREIEAGDDLRQYKRNALAYGKSLRGSYVNRDTGREISLGRSGITEILRHDYKNPEHLQSIAAIPQIIENAVYIDTLPNEDLAKNGDVQGYEYYVSGLNIGGTDYTVRAAVAVSRNGNRYYDHKLTQIEKGNLLSLLDRVSTTGASESKSPLSDIDDKRLLQILQDKDAGKGGIADFDTEAVRFSRAANIGAAISHITGKKSDLRNALKDRWDASKGIQLQFLGRRQIEDIYGGSLDGLKEYGRLSELFGADANKAVTEADKVVREWGRLKKEDAKALADLMHDATLAKVDADPLMRGDAQKRLDGIRTALDIADGKIEKAKAVIASANARIARADAAYDKASEAAKKAESALLAAEEEAGREILADEADMRLRRLFYADSEAKRALRHFNKI